MKKKIMILCLLLWSLPPFARGESARCTLRQLNETGVSPWQETYQAHGRTITVDCQVSIPPADRFPVLSAQWLDMDAERADALAGFYTASAGSSLSFGFFHSAYSTAFWRNDPGVWDESKGETVGKVGQKIRALLNYDLSGAYADNNALTVSEAFSVARLRFREAFPDLDIQLMDVALEDRLYWKKTGEPIREKGNYALFCAQRIGGIPVLAAAPDALRNFGQFTQAMSNQRHRGLVTARVYDGEAFNIFCQLYGPSGVIQADASLVSFDAVRPQVETLIAEGRVRRVYHAGLGYAAYMTDLNSSESFVLAPAWVIWCDYFPSAEKEPMSDPVNGSRIFRDSGSFYPLIFSAQTGEWLDIESTDYSLCLYR